VNFVSQFKIVIHSILLATTPFFLAYPQDNLGHADFHVQMVHSRLKKNVRKSKRYHLVSYDEILDLLEEIESGKKEYREQDLRRINRFLSYLAKEGVLSNFDDALALSKDIEDLLDDDIDDHEYVFATSDEYSIIPAVNHDQADIFLCKNRLSKKWKKTKKFVKNHKKEIIIGAVIVIATATVVVAVVATSSAGAAAAAAGVAGAASSSKSGNGEKARRTPKNSTSSSSSSVDVNTILDATNEAPALQAIVDEQVNDFKEFMAEDALVDQSILTREQSVVSFGEKTKELGSFLAHQIFEEVSELAFVVPKLCEEIKDVSCELLPQSLLSSEGECGSSNPIENYESKISRGHHLIDQVFSTDQAECYENGFNTIEKDFAIGIIPPPGNFSKGLNLSRFRRAIAAGEDTSIVATELGYSTKEVSQLEQAGILEKTIENAKKSLSEESLVTKNHTFQAAAMGRGNAGFLRNNLPRSSKELQKGIKSCERQIALHKDKILNPEKYIENWCDFDPRRKQALIQKKWQSDINRLIEQRDILQQILNDKLMQ